MANELAQSVFATNANETEATVDVYNKDNKSIVSSFQEFQKDTAGMDSLFNFLSGAESANNVNVLQSFDEKNGLTVDKKALSERLAVATSEVSPQLKNAAKAFSEGKDPLLSYYTENKNSVTGVLKDAKNIVAKAGQIERLVDSTNLKDMRSVTGLINTLTSANTMKILDNPTLKGLYSSVVDQGIKLGIPDAFKAVKETLGAGSDMIKDVAVAVLPTAITEADFSTVSEIASVFSKDAVSLLRSGTTQELLRNFNVNVPSRDIAGTMDNINQTLGRVDSNWSTKTRQTTSGTAESIRDISSLLNGSIAVKNVFSTGGRNSSDPLNKVFSAVSILDRQEVDKAIKRQLPKTTSIGTRTQMPVEIDAQARLALTTIE